MSYPKTPGKVPKSVFSNAFSPSEFKSEIHLSSKFLVPELANLLTLAVMHCRPLELWD